jgi:hypothetical protein
MKGLAMTKRFKYGQAYGDNQCCGFPTKSGRPCKAAAAMGDGGEIIGCYLHDPRRVTYAQYLRSRREAAAARAILLEYGRVK